MEGVSFCVAGEVMKGNSIKEGYSLAKRGDCMYCGIVSYMSHTTVYLVENVLLFCVLRSFHFQRVLGTKVTEMFGTSNKGVA